MKKLILLVLLMGFILISIVYAAPFDLDCAREAGVDSANVRFLMQNIRPCFDMAGYSNQQDKVEAMTAYQKLMALCPKTLSDFMSPYKPENNKCK